MTGALVSFASTFVAVFALGFQSQNVNQGHYLAAALTSLAIGVSSILLYKVMPDSGAVEVIGYLVGGVTGITASMWVHRRTLGRKSVPRGRTCVCGRVAGEPCPRLVCEQLDEHADVRRSPRLH